MKYKWWRAGIPLLVMGAVALLGWVVMMLWNAVIPTIFVGARAIDYWHAVGLLVLSRILFGGFRGRGGSRHRGWRRRGEMTTEERNRVRQSFAARCGRPEERT